MSTDDRRLMRVIIIQEALRDLTYEEATFIMETVMRNMDLNDQLRKVHGGVGE